MAHLGAMRIVLHLFHIRVELKELAYTAEIVETRATRKCKAC